MGEERGTEQPPTRAHGQVTRGRGQENGTERQPALTCKQQMGTDAHGRT